MDGSHPFKKNKNRMYGYILFGSSATNRRQVSLPNSNLKLRILISFPHPDHPIMIGRLRFALFFSLFLLFRDSLQLPPGHSLRATLEKANESGPFIEVVMAYQEEADALRSSAAFVPNSDVPSLELYGRRFHVGRIRGVDVVYVMSGQRRDLELQRCINETYCLPDTPKVVLGVRGSTADIFVNNSAYRDYLFKEFQISTVDEENSAIMMVAMSTGTPAIVFRGVSDLAGGGSSWASTSLTSLASANALKVAIEFIEAIGKKGQIMMHSFL